MDDHVNQTGCNCSSDAAAKALDQALTSWSRHSTERQHVENAAGPWDDLAGWYWQYWDEINDGLSRTVSEDRIPSRPLRDVLVDLYFKHVHPLCPIFDEVEIYAKYDLGADNLSFLQSVSLLEFQSMMFVASLVSSWATMESALNNILTCIQHLNSHQIRDTHYSSTHQCHMNLFETARACLPPCTAYS
jgi:hypothetical protein